MAVDRGRGCYRVEIGGRDLYVIGRLRLVGKGEELDETLRQQPNRPWCDEGAL